MLSRTIWILQDPLLSRVLGSWWSCFYLACSNAGGTNGEGWRLIDRLIYTSVLIVASWANSNAWKGVAVKCRSRLSKTSKHVRNRMILPTSTVWVLVLYLCWLEECESVGPVAGSLVNVWHVQMIESRLIEKYIRGSLCILPGISNGFRGSGHFRFYHGVWAACWDLEWGHKSQGKVITGAVSSSTLVIFATLI